MEHNHNATIIAVTNQKGGTGKSATCANLGVGLANEGKKVLLVDFDPQASLTISLGTQQPDTLKDTVTDKMTCIINDTDFIPENGILHHAENVDILPCNIGLSGMELSLASVLSRENTLKAVLAPYKDAYDHILIDCSPSLGLLTINALSAADRIIIPVQPQFLSLKGVELLLNSYRKVRRQINPTLKIDGILWTMVDGRKINSQEESMNSLKDAYGTQLKIFDTKIPIADAVRRAGCNGISVYKQEPTGKAAEAYRKFTQEVLDIERQRQKRRNEWVR